MLSTLQDQLNMFFMCKTHIYIYIYIYIFRSSIVSDGTEAKKFFPIFTWAKLDQVIPKKVVLKIC